MQQDRLTARNIALLETIFGERFLRGFDVRLWDGSILPSRDITRTFTLLVNSPEALRTAFTPPVDLNAGRAFVEGQLDVEGDLPSAVSAFNAADVDRSLARTLHAGYLLSRLPRAGNGNGSSPARLRGEMHSRERDRAAITYHYDHPVQFYESFLDRSMAYSCAYYESPAMDLEAAQLAKLDYIARKLRLRRGMTLLDIGCGWGALVIHAARAYGANVLGITLSARQRDETQRRIELAGLSETARVELRDYRDLQGVTFDRIASIGMVEHVGLAQLPAYFETVLRALRPGGLFLNHGIAEQSPGRSGGKARGFVDRYVFPDGELVAIGKSLEIAERCGFEVRDLENLREHYVRTLRAWVENIERHRDAAIEAAGARAYRTWRLYMAGSAANFAAANIGLFQALLARPDEHGRVDLPPTRADLYPPR